MKVGSDLEGLLVRDCNGVAFGKVKDLPSLLGINFASFPLAVLGVFDRVRYWTFLHFEILPHLASWQALDWFPSVFASLEAVPA